MTVSRKAAEKLEWFAKRHQRAVANAKEQKTVITSAAAAGATGLALGYVKGRYDRTEVAGVPLAPIVGIASHVVAYYANPFEATLLHSAGDAALACAAFEFGEKTGKDRKSQQSQTSAPVL